MVLARVGRSMLPGRFNVGVLAGLFGAQRDVGSDDDETTDNPHREFKCF